jgi:hypothetical protein
VFDCNPSTVNGDVAPVAVNDPGDDVTVNEVAGGEPSGRLKDTTAAPLSKGLFVPIFTGLLINGARGSRKSFCCDDLPPASFFAIYSTP